ncbi:pyruvate carboxylase [Sandaracinus amylolyticus]|uniref:pyruvate carboxylase n=1 Tax=Sandaracinus amylolyticus TaxID=927083 RepID=UPI0022A7A3A1|nr:pyruvate carboxylase [Sandaracinus amylolyticus]UJR79227.1 Pyruvate carboxylase [Sandaracinus amylolyticus]
MSTELATRRPRPITKLLCANRGEIAIRVFRAATELGIPTVAVYSHQDRVHLHRYKADEAYLVGKGKSAVAAYLGIEEIIDVALACGADGIHPGYGFLSENAGLSEACREAGIAFVGPSPEVLRRFGDKTAARSLAKEIGVSMVPGTDGPVSTLDQAREFCGRAGFPVIVKAAMGGGGRGMRVVRREEDLAESFSRAQSEALAAFGDGTVFIERYVDKPRHVEVQILADAAGEVIHLFERDCSVQRRHQKVVEMAPAQNLPAGVREALCRDAVALARATGYRNAGTVEFLVDREGRHYFIEVNPRIQVEHTVTEEVTGIDLVQSQIRIAGGATFADLGLSQDAVSIRGVAIQCRVTTEDPRKSFQPDTGRIEVFRAGEGMGIRLDAGSGYAGAQISPDYDSMLVKCTAHALTFEGAVHKLSRALAEFRVRGVSTNIPFLSNVLRHPDFESANVWTSWVDDTRALFDFPLRKNRGQRLLHYLGDVVVNGPGIPGMGAQPPARIEPVVPEIALKSPPPQGWRDILVHLGPAAFAKAVRKHRGLLVTDTTWRDAHQSLLATRVRTRDLLAIAPATARLMAPLFSLECWGGATFDVSLRFLHECPWDRLERLRDAVPNIPFQMLFRGANAVGYTSYPDNVVHAFAKMAKDKGVDVFRIFDSLNYVENMKLGIDAVGSAGGVIEAAICYTGDVSDPTRKKYSLQYYVDLAGELVKLGIHVLSIKDMAGLLKPRAASMLVGALRRAYPELPIHVHTHDTAGTGVASMIACAEADADVVDLALPAMAGLTSQPTMSAVVAALAGTTRDTSLTTDSIRKLNGYWEQTRSLYAPFESGQTGYAPDLYEHEMPGGQYTNLLFQAQQNGLGDRWTSIKRAYREANHLLGDIIKVTPSSKVVGDLAQFMVQNDLDAKMVEEQADTLSFPTSVVEFLEGRLGQPHGGFPEPLRTKVLRGRKPIDERPGATLAPLDLDALKKSLVEEHGDVAIRDHDVMSAAMYPQVFREYRRFRTKNGDVSVLPTRHFLAPLQKGEELHFDIERGKTLVVVLRAVGELDDEGNRRVFFELNGQPRAISVVDRSAKTATKQRERASTSDPGSVGAPMPGSVVDVRVTAGAKIAKGDPLVVLSAMKMETVVASPVSGVVKRVAVAKDDALKAGDLLVEVQVVEAAVAQA